MFRCMFDSFYYRDCADGISLTNLGANSRLIVHRVHVTPEYEPVFGHTIPILLGETS